MRNSARSNRLESPRLDGEIWACLSTSTPTVATHSAKRIYPQSRELIPESGTSRDERTMCSQLSGDQTLGIAAVPGPTLSYYRRLLVFIYRLWCSIILSVERMTVKHITLVRYSRRVKAHQSAVALPPAPSTPSSRQRHRRPLDPTARVLHSSVRPRVRYSERTVSSRVSCFESRPRPLYRRVALAVSC